MSPTKINIMTKAIQILLNEGKTLDEAFTKYPRLTDEDKREIRRRLT